MYDLTTPFEEWSCVPLIEIQGDTATFHPHFAAQAVEWVNHQGSILSDMFETFTLIKKEMEEYFTREEGWFVQIPDRCQSYMKIILGHKRWGMGLSIALEGRKDFFEALLIGVLHKQTIENSPDWKGLSIDVLSKMKTVNKDTKTSGKWPVYFYPKELQKTGGSNWVYRTKESQELFATAIRKEFQKWALVHPLLDSYAAKYNLD